MAILMLERNVNTLAQSSLNAHWTSGGSSHQQQGHHLLQMPILVNSGKVTCRGCSPQAF